MKKILLSLVIITIVAATSIKLSSSFFSDTEKSTGNVLGAGAIDLKINDTDNPQALVAITDLKPGDDQRIPKKLKVVDNNAWVWMHIKDLKSEQGTQTEPEINWENQNSQKWDIENYLTYDLSIGGNPVISYEDGTLLPDAHSCWIPLGQFPGNTEIIVEQSFHFPFEIENWAQGDTLTFTEEFYATQVRNNSNPVPPDTATNRI